jgi:hypothetical protein
MPYEFKGVFIMDAQLSVDDAEQVFRGCAREVYARKVIQPFIGIGVSFSRMDEDAADGTEDDSELDPEKLKQEIARSSALIGDLLVFYIDYSTWGGPCEYCYGFACRNGDVIAGSEIEMDDDNDCEVLKHQLGYAGFELIGSYFQPFERNFFPNT